MRVHGLITAALAALVLSGCVSMPRKKAGVVLPPPALRTVVAAAPAPIVVAPAPIVAAPAPVVAAPPPVVPVSSVIGQPVVMPAVISVSACAPNYTLDSGDRLRIVVFGQDGLSNTYAVDADGRIMMPLIGTVQARGLTKADLAHTITKLLAKTYIREPHVAIDIELYRPFFILGEVTAPGQYPYVAKMTIEQAVAVAGGFAPRAWKWPVEIRRKAIGGILRIKAQPIDPICPGDTLIVAERWF
jgi:polysaccharide export outer membrane protein